MGEVSKREIERMSNLGIKWEDVRILNSPITNQIYLGKTKQIKGIKVGGCIATDKSLDRTDEILASVMCYMDQWCHEHQAKGMEIKNQMGTLTWRKENQE